MYLLDLMNFMPIRTTIEKCKVIELESGGYELFGWAWNKEN